MTSEGSLQLGSGRVPESGEQNAGPRSGRQACVPLAASTPVSRPEPSEPEAGPLCLPPAWMPRMAKCSCLAGCWAGPDKLTFVLALGEFCRMR